MRSKILHSPQRLGLDTFREAAVKWKKHSFDHISQIMWDFSSAWWQDSHTIPCHLPKSCPYSPWTLSFAWIQIQTRAAASPLFFLKSLSARGSFQSCLQVLENTQRDFCLLLCSTPASLRVLNTLNKGDLEPLARMGYVTTAHWSNSFSISEYPFPLPLAILLC